MFNKHEARLRGLAHVRLLLACKKQYEIERDMYIAALPRKIFKHDPVREWRVSPVRHIYERLIRMLRNAGINNEGGE